MNVPKPEVWIEINLDAIQYNIRKLKKRLKPDTKMLMVVKANAYGHGLVPVAQSICRSEVAFLGVTTMEEAWRLREARVRKPILVLAPIGDDDVADAVRLQLTLSISSLKQAHNLHRTAKRLHQTLDVHLEIDTGMGRLGASCAEANSILTGLCKLPHIRLAGLYSHFSSAGVNDARSRAQLRSFSRVIEMLPKRAHLWIHMANSAGLIAYPQAHFNLVRPGLSLYGIEPLKKPCLNLKPALSLKTRASFVKMVAKGTPVSYGATYRTPRKSYLVTLPLGYASGLPFRLSNHAQVLIRGKRFPIVGRVTMDHVMVNTGAVRIRVGEEVTVIGRQKNQSIAVATLAQAAGTIPYEILTGLSGEIPRFYYSNQKLKDPRIISAVLAGA